MLESLKSERRWWVILFILAVNAVILGAAFYLDVRGISSEAFRWAANGFQAASTLIIGVNYWTKPAG